MVRIDNYDILKLYKIIEEGREKIKSLALKQQDEVNNESDDKSRGSTIQLQEYLNGLKARRTLLDESAANVEGESSLSSIVLSSLMGTILGVVVPTTL